jgi:hypothetical protein
MTTPQKGAVPSSLDDREQEKRRLFGIVRTLFRVAAAALTFAFFAALFAQHSQKEGLQAVELKNAKTYTSLLSDLENCTLSWVPPPPRRDWPTKPFWLPAFPASGAASASNKGDVMKPIINGITGLAAGTKNFHVSAPRLKRCYGPTETAACSNGHPLNSVSPDKQREKFQSNVIFVIRNLKTAFPAMIFDKAMAYHGATEQVPETEWRKQRDEWLSAKDWLEMPLWWMRNDHYNTAMYVQYEKLVDPATGPAIVEQLAKQFEEAGYEVAPKEDLPCIWYRAVQKEWKWQKEFMKYIPGYTAEQRDKLLNELDTFRKEQELAASDPDLDAILMEYYNDIRENTRLDSPGNSNPNIS